MRIRLHHSIPALVLEQQEVHLVAIEADIAVKEEPQEDIMIVELIVEAIEAEAEVEAVINIEARMKKRMNQILSMVTD